MKMVLSAAAVAALLGGAVAAHAGTAGDGRIHVAQMNSPGDGIDGAEASREGNSRPGERGGMSSKKMMKKKPAKKPSRGM